MKTTAIESADSISLIFESVDVKSSNFEPTETTAGHNWGIFVENPAEKRPNLCAK